MVIFNPAQANFLFKKGASIERVVEGKKGDLGIMFTDGSNLDKLLTQWTNMARESKAKKISE